MRNEIIIATRSAGKIRELTPMLSEIGFHVLSLNDAGITIDSREDELEVFDTFEANALAKARWFFALGGGRPVLADDSGLTVDALGGQPGVRSKRWSGRPDLDGIALDEANNALLIKTLHATAVAEPWLAKYVCAASCVASASVRQREPIELVCTGHCDGAIIREPRGAGGFGYDAHFLSTNYGRTFGEASRDEKQQVSHRGRAFRALVQMMQQQNIIASPDS